MQKIKYYQKPNNLMTQGNGHILSKIGSTFYTISKNIIELMISLLKLQFFATNGSDQDFLK